MGLFKADLYRSFAFGFALGAAILGIQAGPELWNEIVPQAQAQVLPAPQGE